jgi:hypothetical protein
MPRGVRRMTKETYSQMSQRHQKMVNDFPIGFAFNSEQFEDAKKKLGVKNDNELYSIHGGGFIRQTDADKYIKMFLTISKETEEAMKDFEFAVQAFVYELNNHEYNYTGEVEDALHALNLTQEDIDKNEMLQKALETATSKINGT